MTSLVPEVVQLTEKHIQPLFELFQSLQLDGSKMFHPHPFTMEVAQEICLKSSVNEIKDMYFGIQLVNKLVGYGFLRGLDAGFEAPSLGIAIEKSYRGNGLCGMFMRFLHCTARLKGIKQIYLKVYEENVTAFTLYKKLGYKLQHFNDLELEGKVTL